VIAKDADGGDGGGFYVQAASRPGVHLRQPSPRRIKVTA